MDVVENRAMRRYLLDRSGLSATPTARFDKAALLALIERLGYVQIDSIQVVERAHHMILYTRNRNYDREMLRELLEEDRSCFEHWTHDACIIPTTYFPHWHHRFAQARKRLSRGHYAERLGAKPARVLSHVRKRVEREGALRTRDFENAGNVKRESWWGWTQEKTALEVLWRCGELAISHRNGFEKAYDRIEAVIPAEVRDHKIDKAQSVAWKCEQALERLGAASPAEIAGFWGSFNTDTASAWVRSGLASGRLAEVRVEDACGKPGPPRVAFAELATGLDSATQAPRGLRLLSPFDPLIRDRKRTANVFGFDYRIEVFVPAAKRQYGYYVFPILEGERLTGRVDLKAHRAKGTLEVKGLWWEEGVRANAARYERLERELLRLGRFVGAPKVVGLPHSPITARASVAAR